MFVSALISHNKINRLMSCYQIFRVALQQLVSSDWTTRGFCYGSDSPMDPPLDAFHSSFAVVFVDSRGLLNVCAHVSRERYLWLQQEAGLALRFLDDASSQGFEALFMKPLPVEQKFDVLCQ